MPRWFPLLLAPVLTVAAVLEQSSDGLLAAVLAGATAATLVWCGTRPYWAVLGFAAGLLALAGVRLPDTPMWAFVALMVLGFLTGASLPRDRALASLGLLYACAAVFDAASHETRPLNAIVSPLVIIGVPAAAGLLLRRSREHAGVLLELTTELQRERDASRQAAVLAERTRIAREMHDVIAHTVVTMVVQAGAAEKTLPADHPAAEAVAAVRRTGRQALDELRQVVGLLREEDGEPAVPQPGIADLPGLLEVARDLGSVDLQVEDDLGQELPPTVQLTVFRTVQESLTNASRYARGASVHVAVRREAAGNCCVLVEDSGGGTGAEGGAGFGLRGLAERAALHGGSLVAGPREDGRGWRVLLRVPVAA